MQERDGARAEVALLRPESWFAERGVSVVGDCVELNLEELDLAGAFQVLELGEVRVSTYVRRAGFGRVTGRFQFNKGETFNLFVAGESRPIGVTGQHPFWSADRNAWVSVRDLRIGERLLVEGGTRVVEKVEVRGEEVVFNIEVDGEHCYRVGEQGVLVHNASPSGYAKPKPKKPCATLKTVKFSLSGNAHAVAAHIRDAQVAGKPKRLKYDTDPIARALRRAIACPRGTCRGQPVPNNSCDEYPFASTFQGGLGASIRCVPAGTNSSQGGTLSHFYGMIIHGDEFDVEVIP